MKLKKIASLALAGVMAVSMLAGCANKPGTTDDNQGEVTTSAVATALNEGQDAGNDVKITFTEDSNLVTALQKAINNVGINSNAIANVDGLRTEIVKMTGIGGTVSGQNATVNVLKQFTKEPEDAEPETLLIVKEYKAANYNNVESLVLRQAGEDANELIKDLVVDNSEGKGNGDTYYKFSYTGKAGLLTVKDTTGAVHYLVIASVTRTSTEAKVEL